MTSALNPASRRAVHFGTNSSNKPVSLPDGYIISFNISKTHIVHESKNVL